MLEYISTRSNPKTNIKQEGREGTVKRTDDLRDLKERKELPVYIENDNLGFSLLPSNYREYKDCTPYLFVNCNNIDVPIKTLGTSICYLSFPDDTTSSSNYYSNFIIELVSSLGIDILFDISDYYDFGVVNSREEKFDIINLVLDAVELSNNDIEIYWENYNNQYVPNSFIIVSNNTDYITGNLSYGSLSNTSSFNIVSNNLYDFTDLNVLSTESELVGSEYINDIKGNTIANRNRYKKVLVELEGDRLLIHTDDSFQVNKIVLSYDKKPIFMNHRANILPSLSNRMNELVTLTAKKMAMIASGDISAIQNETLNLE